MAEMLDILDAFTLPLKIGWVVWFAWGIGLIFWYRYERNQKAGSKRVPGTPARRPIVSQSSMVARATGRLVTPDRVAPAPLPVVEPPVVEAPVVEPPVKEPPLLESAPAPLEESNEIAELERFVADFDMNTRQQRQQPINGEPFDFHTDR